MDMLSQNLIPPTFIIYLDWRISFEINLVEGKKQVGLALCTSHYNSNCDNEQSERATGRISSFINMK